MGSNEKIPPGEGGTKEPTTFAETSINIMSPFGHVVSLNVHPAIEYLSQRGLTQEMAKRLGIEIMTGNDAAFKIKLSCTRNKVQGIDRVVSWPLALYLPSRFSDGRIDSDYGQAIFFDTDGRRAARLCTPKELHPNDATFMPLPKGIAHFSKFPAGTKIFIGESIVKAGLMNQVANVPTIGLNGVTGYSAGGTLIKSFREEWWRSVEYQIVVVYDSLSTNLNSDSRKNVARARRTLCAQLKAHYPKLTVGYIEVPPPPPELGRDDWGVDDFYKHHGLSAFRDLLATLPTAPSLSALQATMEDMNANFAWVRSISKVADIERGALLRKQDFFDDQAPFKVLVQVKDEMKWQPRGQHWFSYEDRRALDRVSFMPGEPQIANNSLNLWKGFALAPSDASGAIERAQKYWADVVLEAAPDGGEHLLDICAVRVQQPERLITRYVFVNGRPGLGKTYIVLPIISIYGQSGGHYVGLTEENFINKFNAALALAHLAVIHECSESLDSSQGKNFEARLKFESDAAQKTRPLEKKGQDMIDIERNLLLWMNSNYDPAFPVPIGDRRGLFLKISSHMAVLNPGQSLGTKSLDWWAERWAWLNSDGPRDVYTWLLARDISKADFDGPAPMTKYKRELLKETATGYAGFLDQLQLDTTSFLVERGMPKDEAEKVIYASSNQLLKLYHADDTLSLPTALKGPAIKMGKLAAKVLEHEPYRFTVRVGVETVSGRAFCLRAAKRGEEMGGQEIKTNIDVLGNWLSTLDWVVGTAKY